MFPVNLLVCCRLLITGPVSHYFYQLMEVWMPTTDPYCIVKRLLLDRLFFAPGFLLIFYFVMNILEVGHLRDCPSLITSVEKAPCRFWYIAPAHAPVSHNNKTHWEVKWITLIILSQSIVLLGRNWFQAFMWKPFDTHHPPKHRCRSCTASPGGGGRGGGALPSESAVAMSSGIHMNEV